jgi:hypothetical protein
VDHIDHRNQDKEERCVSKPEQHQADADADQKKERDEKAYPTAGYVPGRVSVPEIDL